MAELKFYGNIKGSPLSADGILIRHEAGSGLGFFGQGGFGVSVPIDTKQKQTYITNALGTASGELLNNTEAVVAGTPTTPGTVRANNSSTINLDNLPNYLCPLNIRFTNTEPVAVQNCKLRIFDRNNIDNHASGVTTFVWEARHPNSSTNTVGMRHRGRPNEESWFVFTATDSMEDMILTNSPGISGTNGITFDVVNQLGGITASGNAHQSMRHDWYVALSAEPDTIGSKTQYGLYFTLEYL